MVDKKNWTIGGLITLLALSMIGFVPEQTDTHICNIDGLIEGMYCDHISSTGGTCYPKNDTRKGSKYCETVWKAINRSDISEEVNAVPNRECVGVGFRYFPEDDELCSE